MVLRMVLHMTGRLSLLARGKTGHNTPHSAQWKPKLDEMAVRPTRLYSRLLAHLPPAAPAMLRNGPPQHRRDLRRRKARPAVHQVAVDAARLRHCAARVVARGAHQGRVTVRDGRAGHVGGVARGRWGGGARGEQGAARWPCLPAARTAPWPQRGTGQPAPRARSVGTPRRRRSSWPASGCGAGSGKTGVGVGVGVEVRLALHQPHPNPTAPAPLRCGAPLALAPSPGSSPALALAPALAPALP